MSRAKSLNCWALLVVKLTQPSAVGSTDGTSIDRVVPATGGRPSAAWNSANTEGNVTIATAMQSSMATSTWSPQPLRRASLRAAMAPTAA